MNHLFLEEVDQDVEFFEKRELDLNIFEEEQSLFALLLLI